MKVLTVVGARPQFVKASAVSRPLRERHEEVLVHTGQHYDEALSGVFFDELDVPEPEYNLGVGSDAHGAQTAAMIRALEPVVGEEDPDVVLTYGDTNSTLAAAVVASKLPLALAHVEAGLRSYRDQMPEETNRVLTDHASDLLFVPSESARENLAAEGVTDGVHVTGDVMYDALLAVRDRLSGPADVLTDASIDAGEYVLATVHRARNTDSPERLEGVLDGLDGAPLPVVAPLHPRTLESLDEYGLRSHAEEVLTIVEPQGYIDFLGLLDGAAAVATDSGGVQKEACFLGTPCVTLREETEWVETVEAGWNTLVGGDPDAIVAALDAPVAPAARADLYGNGEAAERIVELLSTIQTVDEPTPV